MTTAFRLGCAALCSLSIALAGCATSYGELGVFSKTGYSDKMLNPGTCEVTYTGNAYIRDEKLQAYARLRVARLCQEKNYTHFLIFSAFHDSAGGDATMSVMERPLHTQDGHVYYSPIPPRYKVIARFFNEPAPPFAINAAACAKEIKVTHDIF